MDVDIGLLFYLVAIILRIFLLALFGIGYLEVIVMLRTLVFNKRLAPVYLLSMLYAFAYDLAKRPNMYI